MNKRILAGVAAVALLGAVGAGLGTWINRADTKQNGQVQSVGATATPSPTPQVLAYDGVEGKTALELLKEKDPDAVTKGEGANAYVTSVNGYAASSDKKEYWAFYVNGQMSEVGAGSYVTKAGDKIEWKIATY